jgi:hypothetical protein
MQNQNETEHQTSDEEYEELIASLSVEEQRLFEEYVYHD